MLNFGIIGHGFMGQTHTQTIKKLDYATLIAVCDINKDQLKEVDEGVKTFLKADQLLAEKDIDTVIIAVPNHLHLEMVKKAAAAKILFATGVAMERENKQIAAASSLTLPPAKTTPLEAKSYREGKWHRATPAAKTPQKRAKTPLSQQEKNQISRSIKQLDSLRFNIEKNVAQSQDVQLKNLVSNVVTPLLLRQIQQLVAQLDSDPREATYQPYSGFSGADKSAIAKGLGLACQVQMDLLPLVPDVQEALLSPTLASLVDLQAQLGHDAGPLPGLDAKEAKVKISPASADN